MRPLAALLAKPKVLLPVVFIVALLIGAISYFQIGKPPQVGNLASEVTPNILAGNTVSLSFNTSGRVARVNIKLGDSVRAGEVLASLDTSTAEGTLNQAKGALDLAKAQAGSLSVQYANTKTTQDLLVQNAYRTLLSSGLTAFPIGVGDESHNPTITGTYTCDKEGSYQVDPYTSAVASGFSFNLKGLESANGVEVTYGTPQPLGKCGLYITFVQGFSPSSKWVINIPNIKSSTYQANKNAYDLALATRAQTLNQLSANLGANGSTNADVSSATIVAAEGAYEAALSALNNLKIVSPVNGTVSFVDSSLKVGQAVQTGRPLISVSAK
jgi:multidrug resistance efflux pump